MRVGRTVCLYIDNVLKTALLLHMTGEVESLPDMLFPHNNPGLVMWHRAIHVFGSYAGPGTTKSELMSINGTRTWSQLPDLHSARALFTPVVFLNSIYLCGGYKNNSIECFTGTEMRLLDIHLPEHEVAITCVCGEFMVILQSGYFIYLFLNSENQLQMTTKPIQPYNYHAYSNPVFYHEQILSVLSNCVETYLFLGSLTK